jgi:hypothetical protein
MAFLPNSVGKESQKSGASVHKIKKGLGTFKGANVNVKVAAESTVSKYTLSKSRDRVWQRLDRPEHKKGIAHKSAGRCEIWRRAKLN